MDWYHIWCDLKQGEDDLAFAGNVGAWLDRLRDEGCVADYRITRRKLGLSPDGFGDFHIVVGTDDLAQLDRAFSIAATRTGRSEELHRAVYSAVNGPRFALYRDFPDPVRRSD